MNPTAVKIAGGVGAAGAVAGGTAYGLSSGSTRFLSEEDERKVKGVLEKLGDSCPADFENKGGKCEIPNKLTGPISIGSKAEPTKTQENDCMDENFYWSRKEYGKREGGSCKTTNMTLRPEFEKEVKNWEPSETRFKSTGGQMQTFDDGTRWEIKKLENVYGLFVKEEGMTGDLENWSFPGHFKTSETVGVSLWDMCYKLKETIGDSEEKEFYVYNPKGKNWWDCKKEGFMYQIRNI